MKGLFKFKYPKIGLLIICMILAYFVFSNTVVANFFNQHISERYLFYFLFGILFTFGFTTPFAVGFFIISNPENIFLAAIVGGLGALLADLLIFKIIRFSFMEEFNRLKKTKQFKFLIRHTILHLPNRIRVYLLYALSGLVIASPLPDELGIIMLAGLSDIKLKYLAAVSFIFNTLGILIMILI
ncbi:hypothetical protein KA107_02775 [Candidatus Pacearchaeota archaeon]|nr:hypothetical protein [Candidatus Pacearchaeota archaeon]